MGDIIGYDGYEPPHPSYGAESYQSVIFCSDALNMEAAMAAIGGECLANGPDWFRVKFEEEDCEKWTMEVRRLLVQGDKYAENLLEIVRNDPTKLSDGEISAGATYSHFWYIVGEEDPNMDYFNDWLCATQRAHAADSSAIWVDLAMID